MLYDALIGPFLEFEFMRRALVSTFALAFGAAPIGVILMLRRMSLIGDAVSQAILPGAAVGLMLAGLDQVFIGVGSLGSAVLLAVVAPLVTRAKPHNVEASIDAA